MLHAAVLFVLLALMTGTAAQAATPPLRRVVDLNVGEEAEVVLANGARVQVRLLEVNETPDALRGAVIAAKVRVKLDDHEVWVPSGNYNLPLTVGTVQVDCPITKGYYRNAGGDPWGLEKEARLRLWPAGSPWMEPGSYTYPARQRWFASNTQMANEPTHVDVSAELPHDSIYYHDQLDIGGAEGLTDVIAAADGEVLVRGERARADIADFGYKPRYDRVAVLDARGWLHVYSHLKQIAPNIAVGRQVRQGDPIGTLGKEGSSGGWSHLHYGIFAKQPSGKWGTEEGYAYLVEAYRRAYDPAVLAVARPHHLIAARESVVLDGARSWARDGRPRYQWTFSDGTTAEGAEVTRAYSTPGVYSEILKVSDGSGNVGYDFAEVQVYDAAHKRMPAGIHAAYAPTVGIKAGDPVTFLVRVFNATEGTAVWDFGDGSAPVTVTCNPVKPDGSDALAADGYAKTVHRYERAGRYLVRVEHAEGAVKSTARLEVSVNGL